MTSHDSRDVKVVTQYAGALPSSLVVTCALSSSPYPFLSPLSFPPPTPSLLPSRFNQSIRGCLSRQVMLRFTSSTPISSSPATSRLLCPFPPPYHLPHLFLFPLSVPPPLPLFLRTCPTLLSSSNLFHPPLLFLLRPPSLPSLPLYS